MADAKYSEWMGDVMPLLLADPSEPVVMRAIKRAAIDFCTGSWIWRSLPDPTGIIAGLNAYDLDVPTGADPVAVLTALISGVKLGNRDTGWLDVNVANWRTVRGTPRHFTQIDSEQILIAPLPDTSIPMGLTMTLVLAPSVTSTAVPRWLFNDNVYDIAEGAAARLMLMPGRPWSNEKQGAFRQLVFMAAIAKARERATASLSRSPTRVSYQH